MTARATPFLRIGGMELASLRHGISTRPWNVSFTAGEAFGDPLEGRRRLASFVGIDPKDVVVAGQVHGAALRWVGKRDVGPGALVRGHAMAETDALATDEPGIGLLITAADCPPVLAFDPEARLLAVIHAGWRGTAAGVVRKSLDALLHRGASADRLHVGIGPGIGACCYEVGEEVIDRVPPPLRGDLLRRPAGASRWHLDLTAWIRAEAREVGLRGPHLHAIDRCTSCRRDLFFSHRGDKGATGRFGLLAAFDAH